MKVALVGLAAEELIPLLTSMGLECVEEQPEVVISYGGDGTLLAAERQYPGIPKVPLRKSRTARKVQNHQNEDVLNHLIRGELHETQLIKLVAMYGANRRYALNDIILHNAIVTSAVRYKVEVDGKHLSEEIIGDGLVVATPFGSTAYYRSITHSFFQVGIGLAFNNSIEKVDHLVLRESCHLRVQITRGPALVCADNDPESLHLEAGDTFEIQKADYPARILGIEPHL